MSLRGGGALFFMQRCWGQGVNTQFLCSHASDRVNRIHRAPGDSAQNEAERTNASIGEALVDGTSLKWEYYKPFDGLTEEVIQRLSAKEVLEKESVCMEKNA